MNFKKYLFYFLLLFGSLHSFSQSDTLPFRDRQKIISQSVFDQKVDASIHWLLTNDLKQIPDEAHIEIMYCLNTIFMANDKNFHQRFKQSRFQKLVSLSEKKNYVREIIIVYKDWVPNRGMGYYFPKLNMELYGTPSLYTWYQVLEDHSTGNKQP